MSVIQRMVANRLGRMGMRVALVAVCAVTLSAMPMVAQSGSGTPPPGGPGHWGGHRGPGGPPLGMLTKKLDLTPDQVTQIKGIYADEGSQMKALRSDTSLAQADKRQKMFAIRQDSHTKFMGVLSDDQKTKFGALQAEMKEHRGQHGHGNGGTPPAPPQ
jgi:periplasmic protein CpxP/Spy